MILPTAILVSHLAGAPALSPLQPEPVELQRAKQLMISKPSECITLTHLFLQREEQTVQARVHSRQSLNYPQVIPHYRTPQQTHGAWQLQALCQANAGHLDKAQQVLDRAIKRAQREQMPAVAAASVILSAKLAFAQQNINQANTLLEQATNLLRAKPTTELTDALTLLQGNIYLHQGQYEAAQEQLEALRLKTQKYNRPPLQAWANYLLAENYLAQQQQEFALAHYLETVDLLNNLEQPYLNALTAKKISNLYTALEQPKLAIHYANLAATEFAQLENERLLINALLNLGQLVRQEQDADLALVYLFNALELATVLGDNTLIAKLYLEIGSSYRKLEMYDDALSYLSQARNRFQHNQDQPQLIDALVQLSHIHLAQQEYGLALLQLNDALSLAEQLNDAPKLLTIHQQLALLFTDTNNPTKALEHQQAYHYYYVQTNRVNRLSPLDLVPNNDQQLQQTRELDNIRQQCHELKKERFYFSKATLLLSLMLPLSLYGWHRSRQRHQQIQQKNHDLHHELLTEYKTGLPNWRQLMQRLPTDMAKSQMRSEQWYLNEQQAHPFNEKMYYLLLQVPFIAEMSERIGLTKSNVLLKELGSYLQGRLHPKAQLYDVRDGQFIYVTSQRHVSDLSHTINNLVRTFAEFPGPFRLDTRLSIGIIGHPFLSKAPHALDDGRLGDILFLALAAARQLSSTTQEAAWVELVALDCQQAAFFTGDIRYCTIQAILKGLVKVNSSHPTQAIDWPALMADLNMNS